MCGAQLDGILSAKGVAIDKVINLAVDDKVLIRRVLGRCVLCACARARPVALLPCFGYSSILQNSRTVLRCVVLVLVLSTPRLRFCGEGRKAGNALGGQVVSPVTP